MIQRNTAISWLWLLWFWLLMLFLLLISVQCDELTSNEKTKDMRIAAQITYSRLQSCLKYDRTYNLYFPDDAEAHYRELLDVTAQFRGAHQHRGSGGYTGLWIENHFIDKFMKFPLSYFNGLFPLFVQWSDYHLQTKDHRMFDSIKKHLRQNVLYIAVSQANSGLEEFFKFYPNIIVMGAGGVGNIPIPLIKGELDYMPVPSTGFPKYDFGFFGEISHGFQRKRLLTMVMDDLEKMNKKHMKTHNFFGKSLDWKNEMSLTLFNFAPVGFGRASFRLAEIVQLGRIPIFLYDHFPWIPYENSEHSIANIGFLLRADNITKGLKEIRNKFFSNETYSTLIQGVKKARRLYTYEGVLNQMELFFRDPLGEKGGHLSCSRNSFGDNGGTMSSVLDINL